MELHTQVPRSTAATNTQFDRCAEVRFRALYESNCARILAYVRRAGIAQPDAEDITADVFLVAWRRLDVVPMTPEDRLWLYGVARNHIAKHRGRRLSRLRMIQRLRVDQEVSQSVTPISTDPLYDAISRLPSRERDVVQLHVWEGLSHEEVATVLGCSANASRLRFHRAKARLGRALSLSPSPK